MRLFISIVALILLADSGFAATVTETSSFTEGVCEDFGNDSLEEGDQVAYVCTEPGKPNMYTRYQEGTRMSVGFGTVPNVTENYFPVQCGPRLPKEKMYWPVQWVGLKEHGAFKPYAAIKRFCVMNDEETRSTSILAVFRLLDNGTSCFAGYIGAQRNQNARAIALAKSANAKRQCLGEPTKLLP